VFVQLVLFHNYSIVGYLFLRQDFVVGVSPRCVVDAVDPLKMEVETQIRNSQVCHQDDDNCNNTGLLPIMIYLFFVTFGGR